MGEIKSVKVDNWGVFFLQKLQNFFNKTDYCDLTLQFKDNSQLKVHRLVLSACTDFFNVLEQTCELTDDALVMPTELQADVVVPIVNFMYTGTLEFELRMYSKLLKTAKEMNMTVLLKLLQAHKRTMEGTLLNVQNSQGVGNAKAKGKRTAANLPSTMSTQAQQRRVLTAGPSNTAVRRIMSGNSVPVPGVFKQVTSIMKTSPKMQRGPTRFETMDPNINAESYESSFDAISYESKPMKEEPEEYEELPSTPVKSRTSPFEQLRKGYNNNKRPAVSTFTSPPAKKPNIEDVKEFSEQQRMRKQIAAEYGDDAEYDGVMDDDIHNDDDDDEPSAGPSSSSSAKQQQGQKLASIVIKQSPNEKPTIVVKDSSNSKMDHAKIISEVLRQYPHLVKGNKNIKLKIMPNAGGQPQKIIVKKEALDSASAEMDQAKAVGIAQARQQLLQLSSPKQQTVLKSKMAKPGLTTAKPEAQVKAVMSAAPAAVAGNAAPNVPSQKRRIDSKTMHALIAQGAENITGPWLCLRCGVNGRPISIPSYRGFRRHLINTHKETIDSALCEHCGWRSSNSLVLNHHLLVEHKIATPLFKFPECEHCAKICVDQTDLNLHVRQVHPDAHKQQCIYCNKIFLYEMMLYDHMKTFHKKRAREDGVIDFSDEEMGEFDDDMKDLALEAATKPEKKIKILSDISLPSTILKLEEVPAAIEDDYAADGGPKFVNAEGNEMVLTAEQREEIMSQLEQDHDGGVVMVLNDSAFPAGEGEVLDHGTKQEITEDEFDDNQIYNEFAQGEEPENVTTVRSVIKEEEPGQEHQESEQDERADEDHMEWAENLISAHDASNDKGEDEMDDDEEDEEDDEKNTSVATEEPTEEDNQMSSSKSLLGTQKEDKNDSKKEEDISLKLKMLTGDWTDDELEDDGDESLQAKEKSVEHPTVSAPVKAAEKMPSQKEEQKDTLGESHNKDEVEHAPITEPASAEVEELSHLSEIEKEEKETSDKKSPQLPEEDSNKSEEIISEAQLSPTTTEAETKDVKTEEKSTQRRSSAKTEDVQSPVEGKESLDDEEDKSLNDKENTVKKLEKDPLAASEDEKQKPYETKSNMMNDKKETVSTTETQDEGSLQTSDKVKTIMSEWAEDEDDL